MNRKIWAALALFLAATTPLAAQVRAPELPAIPTFKLSQAPRDWDSAKKALVPLWREGLKTLGLKEHLAFWDKSGTTVVFAAGRKSTYDAELKAAIWSEEVMKETWDRFIEQGKTTEEALQLLAVKSLPGMAHLLRDGMMDEPLRALGIKFRAALVENETVHNWEEAGLVKAVERLHPGIYKEAVYLKHFGWNDVDAFDMMATRLKEAKAKGPAGIMNYVRGHYICPSILLENRDDIIAGFAQALEKAPAALWLKDSLATLRDDVKFERLQEYERGEIAKVGLTPEAMREAVDREEYDRLMERYSEAVRRQLGGGFLPSLPNLLDFGPLFEPFRKKYGWPDPTDLTGRAALGAQQTLLRASDFVLGPIGLPIRTSEGEKAFKAVMASPRAKELLVELLSKGNNQGKLYALAGLRQLDPANFGVYAKALKDQDPDVSIIEGCLGFIVKATTLITRIEAGYYDEYLQHKEEPQ
ncbi:MAG: hypothetical protein HY077_04165 [Elusimicrobia bacterium]|nr:hypothetical protein [Elusimicrobiota bacterium]